MDAIMAETERLDRRGASLSRAILTFALLAIVLRLVRYLLNYPLWCDETMLAANLLGRGVADLARPLLYRQVCPLGFLVAEWSIVRWLGFDELTLRLFPLLCALVSVPRFLMLVRNILGAATPATLVAVALFAVAEPLIHYAAEVKPYSTDLMVSLVLLNLAIVPGQSSFRPHRSWALAAIAPLAISLSLPAVFVIGAIALVELIRVLKGGNLAGCVAYGAFIASSGLSLGVMAGLGQYRSVPDDRAYFLNFWAQAFPPSWRDPQSLLSWTFRTHTGPLFDWVHGAGPGLSWLTALIVVAMVTGAVTLARRHRGTAALLTLPFALTLVAACLRYYPYGMSARVNQFLVPGTLVLTAAGIARLRTTIHPERLARGLIAGLVFAIAVQGLWRQAGDLVHPYRTPWDRTARDLARWFWEEFAIDSELVCIQTDLGIPFHSSLWEYDGTDQYLCYQRIYSPRHRQGKPPRWESISPRHPLRCVISNRQPDQIPGFRAWVDRHRDRYRLSEVRSYPTTRGSRVEPSVTYVICELVPVTTPQPSPLSSRPTDPTVAR